MNPWNRLFLFLAWFIIAAGLGGTYFAHDRHISAFTSVVVGLMLTAVVIGADRADRDLE